MFKTLILCVCLVALVSATTFFKEEFGEGAAARWIASDSKGSDNGKVAFTEGGMKTTQDAKFYQYSATFDEFDNKDKTLVFQFALRNGQGIDCGGGYLKLHPAGIDQENYNGDTEYNIMFGPDICGSTRRIHAIFNYKGENFLVKNDISMISDTFTHVYTLIVEPNQDYRVLVDNKEVRSGSLPEDWDFLGPKEIKDPNASKPEDWVDDAEIADPEDSKPEGWDDVPASIPDPEAAKPDDWDEDLDGEWQAPTIDNPEYKGEWKPKMIPNPDYKGPWVHPMVPNPDYAFDDSIYHYESNGAVGLEIWQVKSGSVFSDILISDSPEEAAELAERSIALQDAQKKEKEIQDEIDRKKREEEAKKYEEEAKKKQAEEEAKKGDDEAATHDEL